MLHVEPAKPCSHLIWLMLLQPDRFFDVGQESLRVIYIDGEMQKRELQDRIKLINKSGKLVSQNLKILTPDLQQQIMPDLSILTNQNQIENFSQTKQS